MDTIFDMDTLVKINIILTLIVVPIFLVVFRNPNSRSMLGHYVMILYYHVMLISELSIQSYSMALFYVLIIVVWIFIKRARAESIKRLDEMKKNIDSMIIKEFSQIYGLNEDDFEVVERKNGDRELLWKGELFDTSMHDEKERDKGDAQ
jgi:hypothetical protein